MGTGFGQSPTENVMPTEKENMLLNLTECCARLTGAARNLTLYQSDYKVGNSPVTVKEEFQIQLGVFFAALRGAVESLPELNADAVIAAAENNYKQYNKPKKPRRRKSLKSK